MIVFPVLCALLIVLALAFILQPLRHPDRIPIASTTSEANVAVYRRQLVELESDLRHRIITNEQFLQDREELEQRLVVDLAKDPRASRNERAGSGSRMLAYAVAIGLPLGAILLYLALGTSP